MVDTKSVISQVQEIQIIIHDLLAEGMDINEPFQVAAIIEKLPPMWKDFKNYLKHKRKELKLEDLIVRLRTEEDSRTSEARTQKREMDAEAKSNLTESSNSRKRKRPLNEKKRGQAKKFKGSCYNCGKPNHMAKDCRLPRKDNKQQKLKQANVIQERHVPIDLSELILSAFVFETNLVDNPREWSVDIGSTSHICAEKEMFSSYTTVSDRKLFMGNSTTSEVVGIGKVVLNMTSGKEISLRNVLHMPDIRKILVFGFLLSKFGFKLVFESYKFVLTKNGVFVGKVYQDNGLFKMNVMNVSRHETKNKVNDSVYFFESFNLWHERLRHVNFNTLQRLANLNVLPAFKRNPRDKFLVHKSTIPDINEGTIMESRNAIFFETSFPCKERKEGSIKRSYEFTNDSKEINEKPKRGKRARIEKSFGPNFLTYMLDDEPKTIQEALSNPEAPFWKEAINDEIDSIMHNHTRELTDLPPGCKTLGCKWILKKKYKEGGSIDKYKARLVAKRFKQKEVYDFFDTYSRVTRITSICILIAIAALHNLEIHQMDVKTAFLNGELGEEIYMEQPERFVIPGQEKKLNGFKINKCDKCVYIKDNANAYVLERFSTLNSRPARTPIDLGLHLAKNRGDPISQLEYARIIGSLIFLTNCTRPDLAYSVNKLKGYCDANWISDTKDSKSTSGYVFIIGGGVVSLKSSKQTCIARSTMKYEFIALDKAGEEAEWLRNFLEDIPCWNKPMTSINIHCDSQSAIERAQSSMYNVQDIQGDHKWKINSDMLRSSNGTWVGT
ncbi:uncharacterized protein LOC142541854 [Primulina tabacum]|uniref:uncharacterized protein LOC142541854 n=1 Tax=Primulina tabacum TaxID=48773 RepID=UPI003F59C2FE